MTTIQGHSLAVKGGHLSQSKPVAHMLQDGTRSRAQKAVQETPWVFQGPLGTASVQV